MSKVSLALNFEVPLDGSLPSKLLLIPAGRFQGRDGRAWINKHPEKVIATCRAIGRDIPIDIEHATHIKGPKGEAAPAQAWVPVETLEVINGAIWGATEWNEAGGKLVTNREYRYYSPAFKYDAQGVVVSIASTGLTNQHNLFETPALNHEDSTMLLAEAIRKALQLKDDATENDAVLAINTMQTKLSDTELALNRATEGAPNLADYVPAATHQLAINRAESAETKLADIQKSQLEDEITELVDKGVEDKKIAPANREDFLAMCRKEGGVETVTAYLEKAPAVMQDQKVPEKKPHTDNDHGLTAEQLAVCRQLGQDPKTFLST